MKNIILSLVLLFSTSAFANENTVHVLAEVLNNKSVIKNLRGLIKNNSVQYKKSIACDKKVLPHEVTVVDAYEEEGYSHLTYKIFKVCSLTPDNSPTIYTIDVAGSVSLKLNEDGSLSKKDIKNFHVDEVQLAVDSGD